MIANSSMSLPKETRSRHTQLEIARTGDINARLAQKREVYPSSPPSYAVVSPRSSLLTPPARQSQTDLFTFIDLFAGIGGIRLGFEKHGGKCLFTSEWNPFAQKTYLANFPETDGQKIIGDITPFDKNEIPDHDVLLAGFPCQPFSIAGVSKKNALGRPHGFECATQGTLFFDVAQIIAAKKPSAFLLENVKNLISHDRGNTFKVIKKTLEMDLGYYIFYKIIDGQHFVPQHRERIIILGFREKPDHDPFEDLVLPEKGAIKLSAILHPEDGTEKVEEPYTTGEKAAVNNKYTLTPHLWDYLQKYAEKHRKAGNGFGFCLVSGNDVARTLSARYYKDGSEILINRGRGKRPRRLTPRECARLMGFDDSFKIPVSDTQAYRQFGNSVVVPMITEMARVLVQNIIPLRVKKNKLLSPSGDRFFEISL